MSLQCVGLIGDVHAQSENLERALQHLRKANVEVILCTGDIPDGPYENPDAVNICIEMLQANDVAIVRGNHDRWLLANEVRGLPDLTPIETLTEASLTFIRNLPPTLSFD